MFSNYVFLRCMGGSVLVTYKYSLRNKDTQLNGPDLKTHRESTSITCIT